MRKLGDKNHSKEKDRLLHNSERVNTPFSLFTKVDRDFVEPPGKKQEEFIKKEEEKKQVDAIVEVLTAEEVKEREETAKLNKKKHELKQLKKIENYYGDKIIADEDRDLADSIKLRPDERNNRNTLPIAKPSSRVPAVQRYLTVKLGTDGRKLLDRILDQALYEWDPKKEKKRKYSEETVRFSQKVLLDFVFTKPTAIKEKSLNVSVEHKVDDTLRLIHENRKKLKAS